MLVVDSRVVHSEGGEVLCAHTPPAPPARFTDDLSPTAPSIVLRAPQPVVGFEVLTMLIAASNDPALCQATYLSEGLDAFTAERWANDRRTRSWVVYQDDRPVGWVEVDVVRDSCGLVIPERSRELEIWLLPHVRGLRIFQRALFALREDLVAQGVSHLVGIAWVSNHASIKAMRRSGFEILGDAWWGSTSTGGMCTVGVLRISADRT